jgi:capsular polysaccharide biosynthesis protein
MADRPDAFDDEIELIDYLRVIWKWKYLIVAGMLVCALVAAVAGYMTPKKYRFETVLKPGVLRINDEGNEMYIDSPGNIKSMIESGTINIDLVNHFSESEDGNVPNLLHLKVVSPGNSNIVKILYETTDIDLGVILLERLNSLLVNKYSELVTLHKENCDKRIQIIQNKISVSKEKRLLEQSEIKNISDRIKELKSEIALIDANTSILIKQRDQFLRNNDENHILLAFMNNNTIQENITLRNSYKNQIHRYITDIEGKRFQLRRLQEEIDIQAADLKNVEIEKKNIQNIQILQPPKGSQHPISRKAKRNVILAAATGLFMMLFLAFFLEYLSKHRKNEHHEDTVLETEETQLSLIPRKSASNL